MLRRLYPPLMEIAATMPTFNRIRNCLVCNKPGHLAKECLEKDGMICFIGQTPGYTRLNCPNSYIQPIQGNGPQGE